MILVLDFRVTPRGWSRRAEGCRVGVAKSSADFEMVEVLVGPAAGCDVQWSVISKKYLRLCITPPAARPCSAGSSRTWSRTAAAPPPL